MVSYTLPPTAKSKPFVENVLPLPVAVLTPLNVDFIKDVEEAMSCKNLSVNKLAALISISTFITESIYRFKNIITTLPGLTLTYI